MNFIDFNRPSIIGNELAYIEDAIVNRKALCGNGYYSKKCTSLLEQDLSAKKILLTTSCTAALEMSAILIDIKPGDEFIVPSYTFTSTVNAFLLRGATPVFIDIRQDTLNLDESQIENLITEKTKAIVVVHYAGIGAEMDEIMRIANKYNLFVIEDAAQGVDSTYKNTALGTIGDLGAYSFHETKNYICGEGGALLINNPKFKDRAEVLLEKGTNRNAFLDGKIDKYTWVDLGSSYVLSELNAAFLYGQLEKKYVILKKRLQLFTNYQKGLLTLQKTKGIKLPEIPSHCTTNGHMFYLQCNSQKERNDLLQFLNHRGIQAVFHYIPLHSAPMGKKFRQKVRFPVTNNVAKRIIRLPIYFDLNKSSQNYIIDTIMGFFS